MVMVMMVLVMVMVPVWWWWWWCGREIGGQGWFVTKEPHLWFSSSPRLYAQMQYHAIQWNTRLYALSRLYAAETVDDDDTNVKHLMIWVCHDGMMMLIWWYQWNQGSRACYSQLSDNTEQCQLLLGKQYWGAHPCFVIVETWTWTWTYHSYTLLSLSGWCERLQWGLGFHLHFYFHAKECTGEWGVT